MGALIVLLLTIFYGICSGMKSPGGCWRLAENYDSQFLRCGRLTAAGATPFVCVDSAVHLSKSVS